MQFGMQVRALALIAVVPLFSACDRESAQQVAGVIAASESFNFRYLRVDADASGNIDLTIDIGAGCETATFTEASLVDALEQGEWDFTRQVGGGNVTTRVPFTDDMLTACNSNEVRHATEDLVVVVRDNADNVIERGRPETSLGVDEVDVDLDSSGQLKVRVFNSTLSGSIAGRTDAPGVVDFVVAAQLDANQFIDTGIYGYQHINPPFARLVVTDVLTNPRRVVMTFSYLAKKDPSATELLLVWDGNMVMQPDL